MSSATRAFATLPPGTVSPVMASTIIATGGRRQVLLGHLRRRAMTQAAVAAADAAASAKEAAARAAEIPAAQPADPAAEGVAEAAEAAASNAFERADEAQRAAYHLEKVSRLRASDLPQRRQPAPSREEAHRSTSALDSGNSMT